VVLHFIHVLSSLHVGFSWRAFGALKTKTALINMEDFMSIMMNINTKFPWIELCDCDDVL
jgi:hypothetical protein